MSHILLVWVPSLAAPFSLASVTPSPSLASLAISASINLSLHLIFKCLIPCMRLSTLLMFYPLLGRIPINSNTCNWLLFLFINNSQINISRPDHSSELWYPTTSNYIYSHSLHRQLEHVKALLIFSSFPFSFLSSQACSFSSVLYVVLVNCPPFPRPHTRNLGIIPNSSLIIFFHEISYQQSESRFLSSFPPSWQSL